jgi:RNA 3'-phosphate cyclase
MITIDGGQGEAGGQILRTAVALSAITKKPVKITNIRKARCNPGLAQQHLMGVKIAGEFCNAKVAGLEIGSMGIEFNPGVIVYEDKKIDIGTAGSIALLLQTLTPILIFTDKKITLDITGGTDVKWSPSMLYYKHIFWEHLKMMGVNVDVDIVKYGFYPKGGGRVKITFNPFKDLKHVNLTDRGEFVRMDVWGIVSEQLKQARVLERMMESFEKNIAEKITYRTALYVPSLSPGCSLHAHAHYANAKLGATVLGELKKTAEKIGEEVAAELKTSMQSHAAVDKFMADQLLTFMALADGKSSVKVEDVTEHCKTNISVCEQMLGCNFAVDEKKKIIEVEGIKTYL